MKKNIIILSILSILVLVGSVSYAVFNRTTKYKVFISDGYILEATANDKEEDIQFFKAGSKYSDGLSDILKFTNTEGEKVAVDKHNFIHYTNKDLSAMVKGVLMDTSTLNEKIVSYSTPKYALIKKATTGYEMQNLDEMIPINDYIWKIHDDKYIVVSDKITLEMGKDKSEDIQNYIELSYEEGGMVKLSNDQYNYQTISNNSKLKLENGVSINLDNKDIALNDEVKTNLSRMVIDSDDNIEINQSNIKNNQNSNSDTDNNTNNGNYNNNNNNLNNSDSTNNAGTNNGVNTPAGTGQNPGTSTGGTPEDSKGEEGSVVKFVDPTFKFTTFEVGAIGFKSSVEITDNENVLTGDTMINLYEASSNKLVYSKIEPEGSYSFDISSESLKPNTDYLLQISSSYQFNGEKYDKIFLEKQFKTESIGIKYEKYSATYDSISVKINATLDSKISSAKLVISNEAGESLSSESISIEKAKSKEGQIITFNGLEKNTKYIITVEDMLYDNSLMVKKFEDGKIIYTLREKPEIGKPTVSINKRNSTFELGLENISNPYNGIQGIRYELYEASNLNTPISAIDKSEYSKVEVIVDNIKIFRNTNYTFRVLVEYDDNEKIVEYSSDFADTFSMEGVEFPTIGNFEPKELQFEKISGELFINDPERTISNSAMVYYEINGDSAGDRYEGSQPATRRGDKVVLTIDQKGLRANESYTIMVYADVNLRDGNADIVKTYVGSKSVRTKTPKYMKVSAGENQADANSRFKFNLKLESANPNEDTEYEANTMQSIVFNLYEGNSTLGKLVKTVTVRDSNTEDDVNEIKDKFYNGETEITTDFFGVVSESLEASEYTIEVKAVNDYTVFPNEIPLDLKTNTITIKANAKVPELPDKDDALDIVIKTNDEVLNGRPELENDTAVQIRAKAKIDNSEKAIKNIIYQVYEASTNQLVKEETVEIGPDGVINYVEFNIEDGTAGNTVDTDEIRRGNTYYLAFKVEFDLDGNGDVDHIEPSPGEMLRSPNKELKKQNSRITMTPREVIKGATAGTNRLNLNVKYLDVDNVIYKQKITVKGATTSSYINLANITSGDSNYKTGWADNLHNEVLTLTTETKTLKTDLVDTITVINEFLFESLLDMNNMEFTVEKPGNFIRLPIQGTDEQLKKIIYVDAIFKSKTDPNKVKTIDNITPSFTGVIEVPFKELEAFKNEDVEVELKAYYDSNNLGLKPVGTGNDFYALQVKSNTTKSGQYLVLNELGEVTLSDHSYGSAYRVSISGDKFKFTNKIKVENADPSTGGIFDKEYNYSNTTLAYLVNGMFTGAVTDNAEVLVKKIEEISIKSTNNTVKIPDIIVPNVEVDLSDISLTEANIGFKVDETGANKLDVGTQLKVELYEWDEYFEEIDKGNPNPKPKDTLNVGKGAGTVKLDNLLIGKKYFVKFYGTINGNEYELGDSVTYELGKKYDFTTLKDVNPSDLITRVESKSESERYAVFKYNLAKIAGISRVSYELLDDNNMPLGINIDDDDTSNTTIKDVMEKRVKLEANKFSLGKNYKIKISVYAKENTNSNEKRVGLTTFDFVLLPLREPVFTTTYNSDKDQNGDIYADLWVLAADADFTIQNSSYDITIVEKSSGNQVFEQKGNPTQIRHTYKLNKLKSNTWYVAKMVANIDLLADGNYETYEKTFNFKTVNDYGVSIGDVSLIRNETFSDKIDIFFENTTNLTTIKKVKYTIYSSDGKVVGSREEHFNPVTSSLGTGIFTHTIGVALTKPDIYNIQINFLSDKNDIIDNYSGKYVYKTN